MAPRVGSGGTPWDRALAVLNAYPTSNSRPTVQTHTWLMHYTRALLADNFRDSQGAAHWWRQAEETSGIGTLCHGAMGDLLVVYGELSLALDCYRREMGASDTTAYRRARLEHRANKALSVRSSVLDPLILNSLQRVTAEYTKLLCEEPRTPLMPNLLY
jgi:hypothetical protein